MTEIPWERRRSAIETRDPVMTVDVRRCIGCHSCSVACKVEHDVPLGEFRMRVRWMEDPADGAMRFLPVFDAESCDLGVARRAEGLPPACVAACPTQALIFGESTEAPADAVPLGNPGDTKPGVRYVGHRRWQETKLNAGAALHPDDEDILYEQGRER